MAKPELGQKERNTDSLQQFFLEYLQKISCQGILGVAEFQRVYEDLMPVQQDRLRSFADSRFESLIDSGYVISIGIAYRGSIIHCINVADGKKVDYEKWNIYAEEYHRLNGLLNAAAQLVADRFEGVPIPATIEGVAAKVKHVTQYYPLTISHRVVAEHAGLGWRGKNGLLINEKYSCALRFASVVTSFPLLHGTRMKSRCGNCTACEDACTFIRYREQVKDYRENCRRYLVFLGKQGLKRDVCGKCIRACVQDSIFKNQFVLDA
ncbi:MAG: hypothetical protein ACE5H4_07645 [Candidatus Thorarchaeota archaeon]